MTSFNVTKNVNESFTLPIPGYVVNTTPTARIVEEFAVSIGAPTFAISQTVAGVLTSPVITVAEPTTTATGSTSNTYNATAGDCDMVVSFDWDFNSTKEYLTFGMYSVGNTFKSWIPFVVTENQGITIISATLSIVAYESLGQDYTTITKIKIGCENSGAPIAPTSHADLGMRPMTSNFTSDTNVAPWTAGTTYTYNITAAVQEVLSRGDWINGHTLAVMCIDYGSDTLGNPTYPHRTISSYEHAIYTEPRLTITR